MWQMIARVAGLISIVRLLATVLVLTGAMASTPPTAAAEHLRGFYVFGHEVRTFQPCGFDTSYWIRADGRIAGRLRDEYRRFATSPYEELYVDVLGQLTDGPGEGFGAHYEGQVVIEDVVAIREKQDVNCRSTARPDVLYIADLGVVCNRNRNVCYDHAGPSIGLTRLFRGDEAADALTARLWTLDPAPGGPSRFAPAEDVVCRIDKSVCLVGGMPDPLLSRALFAHASPSRSRGRLRISRAAARPHAADTERNLLKRAFKGPAEPLDYRDPRSRGHNR